MTIRIRDIQRLVARHRRISVNEMLADRRHAAFGQARGIAMWLASKLTKHSLPVIGRAFERDHATTFHAIRKIERARCENGFLQSELDELTVLLAAGSFFPADNFPEVDAFDAALNDIGFELAIVPIGTRETFSSIHRPTGRQS